MIRYEFAGEKPPAVDPPILLAFDRGDDGAVRITANGCFILKFLSNGVLQRVGFARRSGLATEHQGKVVIE